MAFKDSFDAGQAIVDFDDLAGEVVEAGFEAHEAILEVRHQAPIFASMLVSRALMEFTWIVVEIMLTMIANTGMPIAK